MLIVSLVPPAWAEVRAITATGEYRMGDDDTRADAKQMALQDAKRLALEQAGTYFEGITEVKNFALSLDELCAYIAGIVETTEHWARSTMEGQQQVVRVEVICKIDTDVVTQQIDALRKNEAVKAELLQARQEADRLRKELETKTRELAAVTSNTEAETIAQARRKVLTGQDVNSLVAQAWVALGGPSKTLTLGSSSIEGRRRARNLIEQALALDASNPDVHGITGVLLMEEGNLGDAIAEYRTAIRLKPDDAVAHGYLGSAL
jgi:tetratricopeptide (TPR) repeat protein